MYSTCSQEQLSRGIRDRNGVQSIDGADSPVLALEPAARSQIRGQAAQQNRQAAALKHLRPRFHHDQRQTGRRRRRLDGFLMRLLGLERKPVEAQRTQRHLIRLVVHRREFRAPENLDRRHALHFGEIEFHVLRKAR